MAHVEMVEGKRTLVLDDNECRSCGEPMNHENERECDCCGAHRCSECISYVPEIGADLCIDCACDAR